MTNRPETVVFSYPGMHNRLATLTLLLVSGAAASVLYYFGHVLPKARQSEQAAQQRKVALEMACRCQDDGKKFFQEFHAAMFESDDPVTWFDPEFHFSARRNTCLVYIRYVRSFSSSPLSHQYNHVFDVYANTPILLGHFSRNTGDSANPEKLLETFHVDVPNYTSNRFFDEKKKLFSE